MKKSIIFFSLIMLFTACKTEQTKIQEQLKVTQDSIKSIQIQLQNEYSVMEKPTGTPGISPTVKYLQLKQRYDSAIVMNDSLLNKLQSFENK